jgi:hypothetical protein
MHREIRSALPALVLVASLLTVASCKSKSNPMGPAGGGELNGSLATTGSQYVHTFAKAGTFDYHCTMHPTCASLAGTIVVVAAGGVIQNRVLSITQSGGSSGPYGGGTCAGLSLQRDSVFVGDQITWTNTSPLPHTVTSR